jgi:hypothetical protein
MLLFVSIHAAPRTMRETGPGNTWLEHESILALLGTATADCDITDYCIRFIRKLI